MRIGIVLLHSEHPIWQGSDKQREIVLNELKCGYQSSTVKQQFPLMDTGSYHSLQNAAGEWQHLKMKLYFVSSMCQTQNICL